MVALDEAPGARAATPPMGWMSWEVFRCETDCKAHPMACIGSALFEQQAKHMLADGYFKAGYSRVHVDDCFSDRERSDQSNEIVANATRFPGGFQALTAAIKPVELAVYSDAGTMTCGGYPGSQYHETMDADQFVNEWHATYLKYDGCYMKVEDYPTFYPTMGRALKAANPHALYSCSWPAYLGDDETSKPYSAMTDAGCDLWRNWGDIQCDLGSLMSIVDHYGDYGRFLAGVAGAGKGFNDPDMLLVGNDCIPLGAARLQFAVWSVLAAPLIMGNDLTKVPDDARAILLNDEAIAVDQDSLGRPGYRATNRSDTVEVWVRPKLADGGGVPVGVPAARGGVCEAL